MPSPRVLLVLDPSAAWSRGILKGFAGFAHEANWTLLHYHPSADLDWLFREWAPEAAVLPPYLSQELPPVANTLPLVVVNGMGNAATMASVLPDEGRIAELAAAHLAEKGLGHLTSFRFNDAPFAAAREKRFYAKAKELNVRVVPGWWNDVGDPPSSIERPDAILAWLKGLPKPCGVFAGCDVWARVVARYCKVGEIGIPDEVALVGVDNDVIECEIISPPLSSVAVPWHDLGREAALLVQLGLAGQRIAGRRVVVSPLDVVSRRSSEVLAIADPMVEAAVRWICENATQRIDVPAVVQAVAVSRQRLERRFHAVLGRTIMQEIRRARVSLARQLLSTTDLDMPDIAKQCGFTNPSLMSIAFSRELGQPPSAYRRALKRQHHDRS